MRSLLTPLRVGLLVLASGIALFVFVTFSKKGGLGSRDSITVHALFRDASGLSKKSRVQVAGIIEGEIVNIALEGTRARVTMRIKKEVGLRQDASVTKRSESLLGDYLLDVFPGSQEAPPMPDGGEIKNVVDAQGMEAVFSSLNRITSDIQAVTSSLREVLGGEKGEGSMQRIVQNLVKLSETVDSTVKQSAEKLDAILDNVRGATGDVRAITQGQEETVKRIVENIDRITADVRDVAASVKTIIGAQEGELKGSVASLKQTLNRLDASLANVQEVTEKVKSGQGLAGTILTNEHLGQKLTESLEDVSDYVNRLARLQIEVGLRSDYLVSQAAAKNFFGVRLIPKPDRYYLLEFIDDPRGSVELQTVQKNPPDRDSPVTQEQRITKNNVLKISAEFAKRYYFLTLRFGIIESSGGLGSDFHFFDDALTLRLDLFNFSATELRYPRLRAAMRIQAFQHLFANVGMDDLLNRQVRDAATNRLIGGRDFFFGAGIFFTDDDIKAVITNLPGIRP
jgi:phospholipid/cholesterol/gamma-HCH transport system substrate-binding protein